MVTNSFTRAKRQLFRVHLRTNFRVSGLPVCLHGHHDLRFASRTQVKCVSFLFQRLFKSKKGTSSSKKNELLEDEKPKENPAEPMPKRKSILKNSDKNSNSDVGPKDSDENTSTMTSPHSKKTRFQETCSSSEQWRKDGNKLYASATVDLCASVRDERLKKAIQVCQLYSFFPAKQPK